MDQLLLPYLHASNESERQQHLDELLLLHAAPVVRNTLRLKLGFYVDHSGVSPYNPDAEDLYQEIMASVIQALDDLRSSKGTEIERFPEYVFRVTSNACVNYLRAKSPARKRLKDNVRVILIRHPDLAIWKTEGGEPNAKTVKSEEAEAGRAIAGTLSLRKLKPGRLMLIRLSLRKLKPGRL